MRNLVLAFGLLIGAGCVRTVDPGGPLLVQTPAGWTLNFRGTDGTAAYTLVPSNRVGRLQFSRWRPRSKPETMVALVQRAGEAFVTQTGRSGDIKLVSDKIAVQTLMGEQFNGNYVQFRLQDGAYEIVQSLFMVSDGGPIWHGQFAGTTNDWVTAIDVLKSLRKRSR